MIVDFIYDVATPNGYLAHKVIPEFEKRTNTSFNYVPCLAGGIFKLTNNTPPLIANADVKNKSDYFFVEMNRWIKKHKMIDLKIIPIFLKTLYLFKGGQLLLNSLIS